VVRLPRDGGGRPLDHGRGTWGLSQERSNARYEVTLERYWRLTQPWPWSPPQLGGGGLGINLGGPQHNPRFGHRGSDVGFQANMIATISDDYGVVTMTNSDLGLTLVDPLNGALTAFFE
jgi:hypothetical protein